MHKLLCDDFFFYENRIVKTKRDRLIGITVKILAKNCYINQI